MPQDKFGRLTVLELERSDNRHRKWYKTVCDCGVEKVVMGSAMTSGNTKSCGCLSREKLRARRISDTHSEVTAIILGYKRHALGRGYKWLLSREEVESTIKLPCYYCGQAPSNVKRTKNSIGEGLKYSGIDRKDNSKDYTLDNIVACCKICNYAKSNLSLSEFYEWAKRLDAMAEQWGKDNEL